MKKILATVVVTLFVSLAFAPSLYADVETIYEQNELVELAVEFYGLDKYNSHEVTVTREDADKLDVLFDEVRNELNNATSNLERISIFNDCIVELDKFGLLGENGVDDVERITTDLYKEQIDGISENAEKNYNCLIVGRTTNTMFFISDLITEFLLYFSLEILPSFLELLNNEIVRYILGSTISFLILLYYTNIISFMQFGSSITYGGYYQPVDERAVITYADGWVWTLDKNGIVEFDGGQGKLGTIHRGFLEFVADYYIGARNFFGIRLIGRREIDGKYYAEDKYIGFASEVSIGQ